MSFVFELPEVGEGVVEAEVVSWAVAVGDMVTVDQPLVEITTDKAQIEIPSPRAGRILRLHGEPGDIVQVHAPLVEIDVDGAPAAAPAAGEVPVPPSKPAAPTPAPTPAPAPPSQERSRATPAVRRHARELGVDIHQVSGTGRGGRVTHDDLTAGTSAPAILPTVAPALPQTVPTGAEERVKIVGVRRAIAEQMARSKRTAAHFTYVEEVDATRLDAMRRRLKPVAAARGVKLTFLPIIMKAVSQVLRDFPNLNAVMDEERFELVVKRDHHFGVACDTPKGLFVPVVRSVDQKSILHIAAELAALTERTRAGQAKLDELRGGTFTLTSVGNVGVLATPILNVPEVAILGVNAIRDRAVVVDGAIVVRKMFYLSPSFDHRIIDGAVGARFVEALKQRLENPEQLLLELS